MKVKLYIYSSSSLTTQLMVTNHWFKVWCNN